MMRIRTKKSKPQCRLYPTLGFTFFYVILYFSLPLLTLIFFKKFTFAGKRVQFLFCG